MRFHFCFCFFSWYPTEITSSARGLKISAVTAGIKKYKSILMEKKKKYDKILSLEKSE